MLDAAELDNILPRVHQALLHRNTKAIWRCLDRTARLRWCALAHLDFEAYPSWPWEKLPADAKVKLDTSMNFIDQLLKRLAELAPAKG